jgi:perosamine synthetase
MPVHLYGGVCDMGAIAKIASKYDLFVIEDCAEAIGSKFGGKNVGNFSDIAAFSFFGNKTITTGEGGMVLTNDETLYERCLHIKGQGLAKHRQYWHDIVGYNYRMTNICAAIGLAQLENVSSIIAKKRQVAEWYKKYLSGNKNIEMHKEQDGTFHSYWMVSILVNNPDDREPLRDFLDKSCIETRPLFYPAHTMPMYCEKYRKLKNAEYLGWRGINLPSFPDLSEEQVIYICEKIEDEINRY